MPRKDEKRLRVGVLGCGPIAQAAHFESLHQGAQRRPLCHLRCRRRSARAHGGDLRAARSPMPTTTQMLADPDLDAVIIATSDTFHVAGGDTGAGGRQACAVRKAARRFGRGSRRRCGPRSTASGKVLQVGHMKRFDPGIQAAKAFVDDEMGELLAFKAWYCDSTHRYPMTDAVQPLIITSAKARKPSVNPKADLRRYYMLAHGSHLLDTARYLPATIEAVEARLTERFGAYCWFVDVDLRQRHDRPSRPDGRRAHGLARRVPDLRRERQRSRRRPITPGTTRAARSTFSARPTAAGIASLGADGHFYRRQLEGFADVVLNGAPMVGADIDDGIASVRGMAAIARSAATAAAPSASPMSTGRSDAAWNLRQDLHGQRRAAGAARGRGRRLHGGAVQHGVPRPAVHAGQHRARARPRSVAAASGETGVSIAAVSGTYNMIHPDRVGSRSRGSRRLEVLAASCADMGTRLITLCTGTRDAEDQWRWHADNATDAAWRDLRTEMEAAVAIAERFDIELGIEPELANVVSSAAGRTPPARRNEQQAPAHRARPGQSVRSGGQRGASSPDRRGRRPAGRRDRHGPCQGPPCRWQFRRRRTGRRRLPAFHWPPCKPPGSTAP